MAYVYDSFSGKGSLGEWLKPRFEAQCACTLSLRPVGDAGQIVSRLDLDAARKKPTAHVVVGLDASTWSLASTHLRNDAWNPPGVPLRITPQLPSGFHPFDYAPMSFIVDHDEIKRRKFKQAPSSLSELLEPQWKRQWIVQDPRSSTPGLGFLMLAARTQADGLRAFLGKARGQWLTLAAGWDAAYGIFLQGEAPLVWSYVTSQAYHSAKAAGQSRYRAVLLKEGAPVQYEGAALVSATTSGRPESEALARSFIAFLQSEEVQREIPERNWMLPVRSGIPLPASFKDLPALQEFPLPFDPPSTKKALDIWSAAVETAP